MRRYSEERKQAILKQMMPPMNTPISRLVRETGISDCTLYTWRKEARLKGIVVPGNGKKAEDWTSENKFAVVVETMPLNEAELAEYCRKKGLYVDQVKCWKESCQQAGEEKGHEEEGREKESCQQAREEISEEKSRKKEEAVAG